jgi:hypothetical protein
MKYDVLYNFISPITGKIKIDSGYILIGDKNGFSSSSPILIDIRQDIIDLRRNLDRFQRLDKLDHNRIWIGDYENEPEERLQIGIINLPILSEALFPNPISGLTGDFRIPNPTFDYLSPFDWVMSGPFLPQIYATKYDTFGNPIGTDVSSSLAMAQVRAAQIMKRFDNANFIVGSSTVDFAWENPKMYLIPEPLKQLYGLGTTYTFTKAQSLGALETGLLKNTVNNGTGTLSKAISGEDYVNTADIPIGKLVVLDPLYPLSGHKLIAPTTFSSRGNEVNEFGYPIANTIDILTGTAGKFVKFAVTGIAAASLLKVDNFGEIKAAIPNTDYLSNTLPEDKLFYGDNTDKVSVVSNIKKKNLPPLGLTSIQDIGDLIGVDLGALGFDLPLGKIYRGTDSEIPEESNALSVLQASFWANNLLTRFIIGTGSIFDRLTFPAAQFISDLPPGILQHIGGILVTATPGVDYATPEQLEELRDEAKQAADAAADAADAASDAAGYVDDAAAAVSAAVVAAIFSGALAGAIADAESAADDAEDSADDAAGYANDAQDALNSLLNTQVTLQGDIAATGPLTGALSTTFTPNPSFSGAQYMRIPTGSTTQRPLFPEVGMVRYNTDI